MVFDGERAQWVHETPKSQWPVNWESISGKVYLPRTSADGLLTPFRITWWHNLQLRLPDSRGGEAAEATLRREFVAKLLADPETRTRMPEWYWSKLAGEVGITVTYNIWLLLHDSLIVCAFGAVGWQLLSLTVLGLQRLRGPGPGFCSKCRYDLSGLKTDRCPECGTPLSSESSMGGSAQEVMLRTVCPHDLPTFFTHQLDTEACRMAAFTADDPSDRAAFDAHWAKILAKHKVIARTVVVRDDAGAEHVAGHIASFMRGEEREVTYWIGREHWGKGVATRALKLLLEEDQTRPMYGRAAADNAPSIRVLEKCGFVEIARERGFANARGCEIEEVVMRLR